MKKIIALALALVLALGLATVAFAAATPIVFDDADGNKPYHDGDFNLYDKTTTDPDVLALEGSVCYDGGVQKALIGNIAGQNKTVADWAAANEIVITKGAGLGKVELVCDKDADGYVTNCYLQVTPVDNAVAVNDVITGKIIIVDKNAQKASAEINCTFTINLLNHYIDVDVKNLVSVDGFTTGANDLKAALANTKHELILHAHYLEENTKHFPAYVVNKAQFETVYDNDFITFVWENIAKITLDNVGAQTNGINFKVLTGEYKFSRAELNANAKSKGLYVSFPCTAVIDDTAAIEFNVATLKAALGYTAADKEQVVYIYTSTDGKEYKLAAKGDLAAENAKVVVELAKGSALGYYLFTNVELEASGKAPEKSNTATGASEMVSVCVALAVVSLVAAGAVTVKKISK